MLSRVIIIIIRSTVGMGHGFRREYGGSFAGRDRKSVGTEGTGVQSLSGYSGSDPQSGFQEGLHHAQVLHGAQRQADDAGQTQLEDVFRRPERSDTVPLQGNSIDLKSLITY